MLRHKKTPLNHGGIFLGCVFLEILRSRQWRSRYGARGALQSGSAPIHTCCVSLLFIALI